MGRELGLISEERYEKLQIKLKLIDEEKRRVEKKVIAPSDDINSVLTAHGTAELTTGVKLADLIRRPQLNYEILKPFDLDRPDFPDDVFEQVEIDLKYAGYIKRQISQVAEMRRLEVKIIPEDMDYNAVTGLRLEAREKLNKIRPHSIGQASRISGVSPADISVLIIYLKK